MRIRGLVGALLLASVGHAAETPLYRNPNAAIDHRVEDLLARMTLEEKVGQLNQAGGLTLGIFGIEGDVIPNADKIKADVRAGRIGSFVIKMRRTRFSG